jgi:orotate phosphoribosyltransferase
MHLQSLLAELQAAMEGRLAVVVGDVMTTGMMTAAAAADAATAAPRAEATAVAAAAPAHRAATPGAPPAGKAGTRSVKFESSL